jgi:hypothetical protein
MIEWNGRDIQTNWTWSHLGHKKQKWRVAQRKNKTRHSRLGHWGLLKSFGFIYLYQKKFIQWKLAEMHNATLLFSPMKTLQWASWLPKDWFFIACIVKLVVHYQSIKDKNYWKDRTMWGQNSIYSILLEAY